MSLNATIARKRSKELYICFNTNKTNTSVCYVDRKFTWKTPVIPSVLVTMDVLYSNVRCRRINNLDCRVPWNMTEIKEDHTPRVRHNQNDHDTHDIHPESALHLRVNKKTTLRGYSKSCTITQGEKTFHMKNTLVFTLKNTIYCLNYYFVCGLEV